MSVLFDTSVLLFILDPAAPPPLDPATKAPLTDAAARVEYLVKTLSKAKTEVLIPTPVLTEVLCLAGGAGPGYVQILQASPFKLAPFDVRAAIECADALAVHLAGTKKTREKKAEPGIPGARAKAKFDRQIVAIGRVNRVTTIYSDDADVFKEAGRVGINVVSSPELPLDPADAQGRFTSSPDDPPDRGSW